jgi:hypothetical protein
MFVLFYLFTGVAVGYYSGLQWGWVGCVLGFFVGTIAAFGFFEITSRIFGRHRPWHPVCKNGVCNGHDYKWVESKDGYPVCECKCGNRYLVKNNQFMEVLPDGNVRPYLRKRLFHDWEADK